MAARSAHQDTEDTGHTSEHGSDEPRHERPEDWGWHAEMGRLARVAGVLIAAALVLMMFSNHERHLEDIWLVGIAAWILLTLAWDRQRRKNAWRE